MSKLIHTLMVIVAIPLIPILYCLGWAACLAEWLWLRYQHRKELTQ